MLFFSKKLYWKDFFNGEYIDIHSHLIPKVDDGVNSIEEAVKLANDLIGLGIQKFITTPHILSGIWDNNENSLKEAYQKYNQEFNANNIEITCAAEYMLDSNFMSKIKDKKLLTLKDNIVLVEMSYQQPTLNLFELIFELQVEGYKPVLAHPERYNYYHNNFDIYKKLKKAGCLFQLNLLALNGYYGNHIFKIAEKLLLNDMYDYSGTDVHHMNHVNSLSKPIVTKRKSELENLLKKNFSFKK